MIALSKTTGYAIRALACLNECCQCRQISDVSRCTGVPEPYLAQIVSALVRNGFLVSKRGRTGGLTLARSPEKITLLEIVEAVEGKPWIADCLLNMDECTNPAVCPTSKFWQRIRREISKELDRITLADMVAAGKIALQPPSQNKRARACGCRPAKTARKSK